jgi:GAF domain-containing protein
MRNDTLFMRTLVDLADSLVDDFDVIELLTLLSDRCVEMLDVFAAGVVVRGAQNDLRVVAASSETTRIIELFELQTKEGPCLDCIRSGTPIANQDLAAARTRWPRFAPKALETGFRSATALPLRLRDSVIGALNLFGANPGDLTDPDIIAAQALADIATIAILQHQANLEAKIVAEQLNKALTSRVVIEQAKGMIAERAAVNVDEAFTRLRNYARNNNRRLSDVARDALNGTLGANAFGDVRPPHRRGEHSWTQD